ncbi:hypothetical protein SRHO_G00199480 [Serrasalmus rhombeus]
MVRNLLPPQTMDRPSMALILMCHSPYHTLIACPRCQGICLKMQSQASTRREARGCPLKPGLLPDKAVINLTFSNLTFSPTYSVLRHCPPEQRLMS